MPTVLPPKVPSRRGSLSLLKVEPSLANMSELWGMMTATIMKQETEIAELWGRDVCRLGSNWRPRGQQPHRPACFPAPVHREVLTWSLLLAAF